MNIDEILNMSNEDFNKMSYNELLPVVKYMQKLANQRIYRMRKSGVFSPAIHDRNLMNLANVNNLNSLRAEFVNVADFLNAKTSTIRGAKEFMDLVQGSINSMRESRQWKLNYADLTNDEQSKLWKLYTALKEQNRNLFYSLDSSQRIALAGKFYRRSESFESLRMKLINYAKTLNKGEQNETTTGLADKNGLL